MSQCFEILWWEIFFFLTLLCWLFPNATCIDWCVTLDWILLHFSHRYTDNSMKWKVSGCWKEVIISKAGRSISAFYFWFGQKSEAIADIVSFLLGRDNTGRLISYEPSIRLHTCCCENPYLCSNASAYWCACCFSICTHCLCYWFALLWDKLCRDSRCASKVNTHRCRTHRIILNVYCIVTC